MKRAWNICLGLLNAMALVWDLLSANWYLAAFNGFVVAMCLVDYSRE